MKSFVGPIAIGVMLTAFGWWLNQDRYDVKYTLSEKIPLSFGSRQQEAVQQLEVKNLGNKEVAKVQVKLPPRVMQYELVKNSQADTVDIFTRHDSFELLYAALPPQGSFRLVLKTTDVGISKHEVQVRHSRGSAEEALADASSLRSILVWLYIGVVLFVWTWVSLLQFRDLLVNGWKYKAEYQSEEVLRASKPIHIPRDRWKEIRDKAIARFGEFDRYGPLSPSDIANSPIYRYLNSEKPEYLSEEEWQQFRQSKTQQLLEALNARAAGPWVSTDQLLKLLKIEKPIQLPFDKWEEWQGRLAERSFANLSMEIERQKSPLEFLDRQDLQGLKHEPVQRLKARVYRLQLASLPDLMNEESAQRFLQDTKPTWLSEDDYRRHKAIAERTLRVVDGDRTSAIALSTLERMLAGTPIDMKAIEELSTEWRQKLVSLDEQIRLSKDRNTVESERISRESEELKEEKTKVLRQLAVLHDLLVDPASIDRIESYDNPFAPGNLEVLKKISIALRDGGQGGGSYVRGDSRA